MSTNNNSRVPQPGDLLEFFDGEGFVSGTMMDTGKDERGSHYVLQVGNNRQRVHYQDVVAILKTKEQRSDVPLLEERFSK